MPLLTRELLDKNPFHYSDWQISERGKALYQNGRVELLEFDGHSATCRVLAPGGNFTTILSAVSRSSLNALCNCPVAARKATCEHMVASGLAVREYLKTTAEKHWQYQLGLALENTPRRPKAKKEPEKMIAVLGLEINRNNSGDYSTHLYPFWVSNRHWPGIQSIELLQNARQASEYLDQNRSWVPHLEALNKPLQINTTVNLSPEGLHLFNLLISNPFFYSYSGITHYFQYLPLIGSLDIPCFC